ncbi:molecular chaperone DnaJ [Oscillospiraceae bacterium OttesenSCG-928-G22]|nr:molecular chaperone DnaJ [Oscillospiraceae bacterium OttesenSCG-928-G22]
MAEKRDYYEELGVQKDASGDDIKRAYRKLAKEYHPDVNPDNKSAEEKFKAVNEAYEVLSDSEKKARYDQFGFAGVDPNYGSNGGYGGYGGGYSGYGTGGGFGGMDFDLGSIFESFFGGGTTATRQNAPTRGESIRAGVVLSFEEAAFGCEKDVSITRIEACDTCHGSGAAPGTEAATCGTCGGAGQVRTTRRTALGMMSQTEVCHTCGGKGKIISSPCGTCGGAGRKRKSATLKVKIPAGIDEGQMITLHGEGNAGTNGGSTGDLYISVQIRPHPVFTREGTAVHCEVPITFIQASLGAEIEVPTLDGKVRYDIPEGTQTGTTFRLKGKGIPKLRGGSRGDQYVRVFVEVPKSLTQKQKEILREFGESLGESNFETRKGFFDKLKDAFTKPTED